MCSPFPGLYWTQWLCKLHKGPLRKCPTPLPQTLGPLGETVLWGQSPSGLPPGPLPRPGRRQPASAMSVKSHRGQQSVPREGAFRLPESLGGQWRVTRIQWVKLSQAVWLLMAQTSKESACDVGDPGSVPGLGNPLEEERATHSSNLA